MLTLMSLKKQSNLIFLIFLFQVNSVQWNSLESTKNNSVDWPSDAVVALIEWLPNLTKTTMPIVLRDFLTGSGSRKTTPDGSGRTPGGSGLGKPLDVTSTKDLSLLDENVLTQLVQWSDLIIFDYLTGNYDRVASMQVRKH